jgi:hypothetical protein
VLGDVLRFASTHATQQVDETLSRPFRSNAAKRRMPMTEDENKVSTIERHPVLKSEPYEVADFARKHGLSMVEARSLMEKFGNDCMKLDAAAKKFKRH